jgi:lipopolysaccharide/colanic/teichoic acid biosynthesis glycosyltransferase
MSMVGISLYPMNEFESLSEDTKTQICKAKPGIASWSEISLDNRARDKHKINLFYINGIPFLQDTIILVRAISIVTTRKVN